MKAGIKLRQDIKWAASDNFTKTHTSRIIDFARMCFRIINQSNQCTVSGQKAGELLILN
jgi:hypothetical protein